MWRSIKSKIRLFTDDCIFYRKILNLKGIEILQADLNKLGDWVVENVMKINPSKIKAVSYLRARVKDSLNYVLRDQNIPEAKSYKYLGIITLEKMC
jgi:hypothetical protein